MTSQAKSITLAGVEKSFGRTKAVHPIDLKIAKGEFLTLLGPSGCGKTTILRMIAGLEEASTGQIIIGEDNVTTRSPRHRDVAIMFQDYALFPHMSVLDNVGYGLKMRGQSVEMRRAAAREWLERMDLATLSDRKPESLSGGQRQRVALARALITGPGALLLDEPLSALDANLRVQLRDELRRIHREVGSTFICVTHDQEEAMTLSDRIVVLKDGRIEQVDTPDALYDAPASAFVAKFFGRCTLWPAKVVDRDTATTSLVAADLKIQTTGELCVQDDVGLVIRPETLELCEEPSADLSGIISEVVTKGPVAEVSVALDCGLTAQIDVPRNRIRLPEHGARTGVRFTVPSVCAVRAEG